MKTIVGKEGYLKDLVRPSVVALMLIDARFGFSATSHSFTRSVSPTLSISTSLSLFLFDSLARSVSLCQRLSSNLWHRRDGAESIPARASEAMTWPLVVPKNADEPTSTTVFLRFCQMLASKEQK